MSADPQEKAERRPLRSLLSRPLPLEVGPLNPASGSRVVAERCKFPIGVWGRATAEI